MKFLALILILTTKTNAQTGYERGNFYSNGNYTPYEALFNDKRPQSKSEFTGEIDTSIELGIGADCGAMSFINEINFDRLKSLTIDYVQDLKNDVIAAAPMIAMCSNPFTKEACEVVMKFQQKGALKALFNLNHCRAIDKNISTQFSDIQEEQAECIREEISENGGSYQLALSACPMTKKSLKWAGKTKKSSGNLMQDSGKWANFNDQYTQHMIAFLSQMIGEITYKNGKLESDFGKNRVLLSPLEVFKKRVKSSESLCISIKNESSVRAIESKLSAKGYFNFITKDSARGLFLSNLQERERLCQNLVLGVEKQKFESDIREGKTFLYKIGKNPNLGKSSREILDRKVSLLNSKIYDFENYTAARIPSLAQTLSKITLKAHKEIYVKSKNHMGGESYEAKNFFMGCDEGDCE